MEVLIPSTLSIICILIILATIAFAWKKKILITYSLIVANFILFLITVVDTDNIVLIELGFRPIYLTVQYLPQVYTLFTSMFLHGGFAHIFGNMIVFLFMGIAFEQRIGKKNFILIYLITGVCGALVHSIANLGSDIILIGASGAIFGILGAFAYSYPRDEVILPIPLGIIMIFRRVKVMYAAALFAVFESVIVFLGVQDNTAHLAHLGGLLSGVLIAAILVGKQGEKTDQTDPTSYYYNPTQIPKKRKINFSSLRKLAISPEQKELLARIENETVLQVRDIWLDHFLDKAICPTCGKILHHLDRKIWCEDNHIKMEY
ncbi:MAG: rhomboid family intramembrane serine protease [Thermoplasmatota archaeon]